MQNFHVKKIHKLNFHSTNFCRMWIVYKILNTFCPSMATELQRSQGSYLGLHEYVFSVSCVSKMFVHVQPCLPWAVSTMHLKLNIRHFSCCWKVLNCLPGFLYQMFSLKILENMHIVGDQSLTTFMHLWFFFLPFYA